MLAMFPDRVQSVIWTNREGDLLCGSKNSFIVTLVERHSRYVMLAKIPNKNTETVVNALIKQARKLQDELYKSLTLGSQQRTSRSPTLHYGNRHRCLFLRPTKPLAAWLKRKHKRPTAGEAGAKVDSQVAAPAELRTPNLHRANNRSPKSADGRMATEAARLELKTASWEEKQKPN